jgi:predicted transcriptional regulator
MAEILQIAKEGTLKTQIMYKANLSFTQLNDYLLFLQNNNLITQTYSEGKEVYVITIKGINFLQRHRELTEMLRRASAKKVRGFQQSILIQKTQR